MKDETSAAKFHYIKTVSGNVVEHSIAFRVVSIYWQRNDPFPLKSCLQVTCPILSMVEYHWQERAGHLQARFQGEGVVPLPICWYHSKGNWMLYNFAADSFYIMKLYSRLFVLHCRSRPRYDTSMHFDPHFEEGRGGVEPWLMARWKARVQLPIRRNWTFFASSYRWGATRQAWLLEGGSVWAKISGGSCCPWWIFFGFYKTRHILLSNSANCTVLRAVVLTQYRRVTEGRTDRQTDGIAVASTALAMRALRRAVIKRISGFTKMPV